MSGLDSQGSNSHETMFKSKELEDLLDVIDKLRSLGISRYVDLPQLIVCGDQSSGKSSVLEAVSGMRFPTKDNLCTRFPTELILRRSLSESATVTIIPDPSCSDEEKVRINQFETKLNVREDFGAIIDAAATTMGLDTESKIFSNHVLRVELTGPSQPHLTLVDLPGVFHAGNKSQSEDDAIAVKTLVTDYMKKPRSIILAVVSAKNDYANQIVTKFARNVDPGGERTMGIIAKPDTLHAGSESEKQFLKLAENKDVVSKLGWHVLKNRDFNTKDCSAEQRDKNEADFFSRGIWSSLVATHRGIGSLRPRLAKVLRKHNERVLPELRKELNIAIDDCKNHLARLGAARTTSQEQRMYLHKVSQDFCDFVSAAVQGHYDNQYFMDQESNSGYRKRIRAVVSNILDEFAEKMKVKGHQYEVVDSSTDPNKVLSAESSSESSQDQTPIKIGRDDRFAMVADMINQTRGQELPGFMKHETITILFRDQCAPWQGLVKQYAELIFDAVRLALDLVLEKVADSLTKDGLLRHIVNPKLDKMKQDLDARIEQNLKQHISGHPITKNHYLTDNVQKTRQSHNLAQVEDKLMAYFDVRSKDRDESIDRCFSVASLARVLTEETEADSSNFACSEALCFMDAYYKVALKFMIDDFCIHTIEQGMLVKLADILNPVYIFTLPDATVQEITGETAETRDERACLSEKLQNLEEALVILCRP